MTRAGSLLALKVDVDTLRGTREGVPRLARLFQRYGAGATFLFSVGPDHTGRALRRVFRPGFLTKVARTSVLEHYGLRTLLYGVVLPGPHIGRTCMHELQSIRSHGFEVGLHAYDHVRWQDFVAARGEHWAQTELQRGIDAFVEVFGERPKVHGAAGWQMSEAAFEIEARAGFDYCSDTRGTHPFIPRVSGRSTVPPPQLPTTLPTLDELIGIAGTTGNSAATQLLRMTSEPAAAGHVFTLHAELEGMRLLEVLVRLIEGWIAQGYRLVCMRQLFETIDVASLPTHEVAAATISGRSGTLMTQGASV
jgi:undecaprenyl phosphate-alpha-L-ara4FN deformylase